MSEKRHLKRLIATAVAVVCVLVGARAQSNPSPCPEVRIVQKYDHVVNPQYQAQGWDTAVTCAERTIELNAEPYIPVQYFNGTYQVDEIPYAPADPSFSQGTKMPISTDDDFSATATAIPYPFYFFGIRKDGFRLGANGMITFATSQFGGGNACPYAFTAGLPWPNGKSGAPSTYYEGSGYVPLARMRDAIYGIYEDTHPIGGYLSGTQGIYYGIQDEFPCRKIICSWNGIPTYPGGSNLNNRCTYQIVCYEGSNIIEVHVKHRGVNTNWQNGMGIIGIQNATGQPQVPADTFASNYFVVTGSDAAFWPEGKNMFNTQLDSAAYRFTPMGSTSKTCYWFRLMPNGDSITLSTNPLDTNGYYMPMGHDDEHPTLTKALVSPGCASRYVCKLSFMNANGDWYHLYDTITIGIDTINTLQLKALSGGRHSGDTRRFNICRGQTCDVRTEYTDIQYPERVEWKAWRMVDGARTELPETAYELVDDGRLLRLPPLAGTDTIGNHNVDTIYFRAIVDFVSGCTNYDTLVLFVNPTFDTTERYHICQGESLTWHLNGQKYTESTKTPRVTLATGNACDSVVHLDLTVYNVSHTTEVHNDCRPLTWHNGHTYTENNYTDTVRLQNQYGCDSIVQLDFTLHPMTARLAADLDHFDYDHVDVVLTDETVGDTGCLWLLPTGAQQRGATAHFTVPVSMDTAHIAMVAYSPYGCTDTARISIPFHRENIWMPNAFTPDNLERNNRFGSRSEALVQQEMYIYDRYGRLVFRCEGVDCEWDGTDLDGQPCRQGAYAYILRYTDRFEPNTTKIKKGTVTLIR